MQTMTIALIFLFAVVAFLFVIIKQVEDNYGERLRRLEQEIWKLKWDQLKQMNGRNEWNSSTGS